ncbi:hypothetical protein [Pseudoxanthomonas sp. PXM02]|nr:hypothetical protein [Pseudoxanthomonas sp. PXM02]MBD9479507.1 hypothetical protein [Pseudoxanthomonas sp. PXM02]
MAMLFVLLVVWFGYTLGKDLAARDNGSRADCVHDGVVCGARRHDGDS